MDNNIFRLQLAGTAMGTPLACSYATISFGHHENTKILEEFQPSLLYYKRYIDNILGIWIPPLHHDAETWNQFKDKLNSWGSLKWVIEEPSHRTQFLDLDIQLKNSSIITETYQISMNIHLYIPLPPP
jgi:hypothetical protein